jgi:hypothetical protein
MNHREVVSRRACRRIATASRSRRRCGLTAALVSLVLGVTGCGTAGDQVLTCTSIDCFSGVSVEPIQVAAPAGERVSIRVCVNSRCREGYQTAETLPILSTNVEIPVSGASATVKIMVRDQSRRVIARGTGTARVLVARPNGADCEPLCHQIHVRLEGTHLVSLPHP